MQAVSLVTVSLLCLLPMQQCIEASAELSLHEVGTDWMYHSVCVWARSVQELPGCECFPDSAASVFGSSIGSMPDVLTT